MKKMIVISVLGVIILGGVCAFFVGKDGNAENYYNRKETSQTEKMLYNIGAESRENIKSANDNEDDTVVDSENIKKNAEVYAKETNQSSQKVEKKMTEKSIEKKALLLAARDEGISVTEQEVSKAIQDVKEAYNKNETSKKELQAVIAGTGLSEKEYWDYVKPEYEENMVINKYLESKYKKKAEQSSIAYGTEQYYEKAKIWREDLAQEAVEKYNITVE